MEDLAREDRERLERFLEWERATRRATRRRQRRHVSAVALAGVVVVTIVAAWISQRGGETPAPHPAPAEQVSKASDAPAAATTERPAPPATESAPAPATSATAPAAAATGSAPPPVTGSAPPAAVIDSAPPAPGIARAAPRAAPEAPSTAVGTDTAPPPAAPAMAPSAIGNSVRQSPTQEPAVARRDVVGRETRARDDGSGVAVRPTPRPRTATEAPPRAQSPPTDAVESARRRDVAVQAAATAPSRSAPADVTPRVRRQTGSPTPSSPVAPEPAPPIPQTTAAAPSPSATAVPPPAPPAVSPGPAAARPDVADTSREDRLETLKRWAGYIPEIRLGKAIVRWVKSQPPPEGLPDPPDPLLREQAR